MAPSLLMSSDVVEARTEPPSGAAMDRVVQRRSPWPRRLAMIGGGLAIAIAVYVFYPSSGRSLTVDDSRITTAKVVRGKFDDIIQVRGRVTPLRTIYVTTASGGQVESIAASDGAIVTRGQPLATLSNTQLQLDLISREAQITEQLNLLRGLELTHAQSKLSSERELVEVRHQIRKLTRQLGVSKEMADKGAGPKIEADDLADELDYNKQRLRVQTEGRAASDRLQAQQAEQMRGATQQLEKNLVIARKNLDSLNVKAPVDGKLSAFTLEVGQSLAPGERIAQIDDPDHYKVLADIDEFYLSRIAVGQTAEDPLERATFPLAVAKIRPQVQNNQFLIELTFTAEVPSSVRRGQTAQIRLQLGQPSDALLVPNAAFYNDTGDDEHPGAAATRSTSKSSTASPPARRS
jgi:HlyD family secretion protein